MELDTCPTRREQQRLGKASTQIPGCSNQKCLKNQNTYIGGWSYNDNHTDCEYDHYDGPEDVDKYAIMSKKCFNMMHKAFQRCCLILTSKVEQGVVPLLKTHCDFVVAPTFPARCIGFGLVKRKLELQIRLFEAQFSRLDEE
ncbi:hypothetical protein DPMN_111292 [Dreissena polymorpha]|uniref:Uncharacterized protein n=1 Tax=Dreissena polymorpha TaxID=45954 RepID=A0A9D4KDK6_DREPO|nr:hypothetical protein DPMN_111292 [Dreissena polymorpha]